MLPEAKALLGSMDKAANKTAGSDLKGDRSRKTRGFTKAQIAAMARARGSPSKHSRPPSSLKQTVLPPLREDPEIEASVTDPHPVASVTDHPVASVTDPHPEIEASVTDPHPVASVTDPHPEIEASVTDPHPVASVTDPHPEIEANLSPVADPHPVASQPPPSDASQTKLPLPNSTEVVATVPLSSTAPSETQKGPVRGRAKRNISSTARPLRRSSRLNPSSTVLEDDPSDKGTPHARSEPEPSKTEPSKAEPPKSMPTPSFVTEQFIDATIPTGSVPSTPSSPADPESGQILDSPQAGQTINLSSTVLEDVIADEATAQEQRGEKGPEAGHSGWSDWDMSESTQERVEETSEDMTNSEEDSAHPAIKDDDGSKRTLRLRPLRSCDEAKEAHNREFDEESLREAEDKTTRKRKRAGKSEVRRGRGKAISRRPAAPDMRPELIVVGDVEFTSSPICTKIVTTVRILTLECMPGPYRTYNMFPIKARVEILKKFLQRYTWGEGENVERCLDVFERIASEAYYRAMTSVRREYTKKYGNDKEVWKDFPPQWCKNVSHWKGLCLIWSKEKFAKISTTNRNNKKGGILHHVAGSRSSYRHAQKLASEKGSAVGLKEVFDRMHMKESPSGKVYVNEKASEKMVRIEIVVISEHDQFYNYLLQKFEDLKRTYGEVLTDECLWELAVDGEDGRGRLFGFGNRSRISRVNRALAAEDATMSDAGRSTATSAENERERFTKAQVAALLASKLAEERRAFASELAAQEKRHMEDFERQKKNDEYNRECIAALFRLHGQTLPPTNGSSRGHAGDSANEGGEAPENSRAKG
ncbi:Plant transposase (Ptta/En/Spm family) [Carex littledalei]|uniref:Plant transposase (Ptta/En/Spm family) n=1 Tax=Carex littledalei TaxID=544730 RepID=A0A833RAB6_9POAL|nr:Plant transposase (Ptta/En/Spm family) [Carex littledalei]